MAMTEPSALSLEDLTNALACLNDAAEDPREPQRYRDDYAASAANFRREIERIKGVSR